jgi:hypothetical protein
VVVAVEEASSKTYEFGGGVEAGSYRAAGCGRRSTHRGPRGLRAACLVGFARTNIGGNRTLTMFGRLGLKPKTTDRAASDRRTTARSRRIANGMPSA